MCKLSDRRCRVRVGQGDRCLNAARHVVGTVKNRRVNGVLNSSLPFWILNVVTELPCSMYGASAAAKLTQLWWFERVAARYCCTFRRRSETPVDPLEVDVHVQRQADLVQIVAALRRPGRLAGGLDGRQQQGNQNPDDRDDHQQLH